MSDNTGICFRCSNLIIYETKSIDESSAPEHDKIMYNATIGDGSFERTRIATIEETAKYCDCEILGGPIKKNIVKCNRFKSKNKVE